MANHDITINIKQDNASIIGVGHSNDDINYQVKRYESIDGPILYIDKDAYINVQLKKDYDKDSNKLTVCAVCNELGIEYKRWTVGNQHELLINLVVFDVKALINKQFESPVKVNFFIEKTD